MKIPSRPPRHLSVRARNVRGMLGVVAVAAVLTLSSRLPGAETKAAPQPTPLYGWEDRLGWKIRMNRGPADAWGDLPTALRLLQRGNVDAARQQLYTAAYNVLVAQPEATFVDLSRHEEFRRIAREQGVHLLGGPMLGAVHAAGAQVWVRTVMPAQVTVAVNMEGRERLFGPVETSAANDLAAMVPVHGLEPASTYSYRVLVDGREVPLPEGARITTTRGAGSPGTTRFIFGGDFHRWGFANGAFIQRMLDHAPHAMLLLGDLAVSDRFTHAGLHRADYLLRDMFAPWQRLAARVPLYATWDDHDYLDNDLSGRPPGVSRDQQLAVWSVFRHSWSNPQFGFDDEGEGVFLRTTVNDIDVIMLDTRYFRRPPPDGTMLGERQMGWLERQLQSCKGKFIVLSSGTMWTDHVSEGKDSWGSFAPEERERIFALIEKYRIAGVLLISADRHGATGYRIPRADGFNLYEFEVGSLGGISGTAAPALKAPEAGGTRLYRHGDGYAFGEFTFDTAKDDPTVTFGLINEAGESLYRLTLKRSQLTP